MERPLLHEFSCSTKPKLRLDCCGLSASGGDGVQGWDVKRLYFGRHNKPDMDEEGVELVKDLDDFLKQCDVVSINVPLTDKTK